MKCKSTLNLHCRRGGASFLKTVLLLSVCAVFLFPGNAVAAPSDVDVAAMQTGSVRITGTVMDNTGQPVIGAAVMVRSNGAGVAAAVNGHFTVNVPSLAGESLVVSSLGYTKTTVALQAGKTHYDIVLASESQQIQTVQIVSDGIFVRDKLTTTGSEQTFSGEELRAMTNTNALNALKTLDPSFVMIENLEMGSDPNTMGSFNIRGQNVSSIGAIVDDFNADPNQPLFVLDGIEVPISTINDLDMNRIESMTILKDAGSTAIYGSKGANGVVVVETIKPKPGQYNVRYSGDFQVSTPDLSVYNMMDASEKLEFERLSLQYYKPSSPLEQKLYDQVYNSRLAEVNRGVDTYWMRVPLRTGFTHGHSVTISGGTDQLRTVIGAKYKKDQGVMKGSDRETWGANIGLDFRHNKLIISNTLDLSGTNGENSPYGSFSTWVNTSPYYRKYDSEGNVNRYLMNKEQYKVYDDEKKVDRYAYDSSIYNPLYNALLDNENYNKSHSIRNNFVVQYDINSLRLKAGLTLNKDFNKSIIYKSPDHSDFTTQTDNTKKGSYNFTSKDSYSYKGYITASYTHSFEGGHNFTGNVRGEISQDKGELYGFMSQGFPRRSQALPNLGTYPEDGRPSFSLNHRRNAGLIAAINYNYNQRYLFDATYRLDGATTFGSNKVFQPFWSLGAGWNINKEKFAENWDWAQMLKIRGSLGTVGNQNIGSIASESIYKYFVESNIFGQGLYLDQYANPNLPWQKLRTYGVGIDLRTMKGRLTVNLDYYYKKTDPLIMKVPTVLSTGIGKYPVELGYLKNRGFDGIIAFSPIYNLEEGIIWTIRLTGGYNKGEYGGLGDRAEELGDENTMQKMRDGQSPSAIWAVKSLGIDPSSGREVFIKKDGTYTYNYDKEEQVVVGDTRPTLQGVISTSVRYKNLTAQMAFRYTTGGDIYNQPLYTKVENITSSSIMQNQDRRALYNRWKQIGDISRFKSIEIVGESAPRTGRFVQKNNYFKAESISVGYELNKNEWVKKNLGAESVKLTFYTSDLFRIETSKTERGTEYPFARTFSMTLSVGF